METEQANESVKRTSANYYVIEKCGIQEFHTKLELSKFLQDANIEEVEAIIKGQSLRFETKSVIVME